MGRPRGSQVVDLECDPQEEILSRVMIEFRGLLECGIEILHRAKQAAMGTGRVLRDGCRLEKKYQGERQQR